LRAEELAVEVAVGLTGNTGGGGDDGSDDNGFPFP